MSRTIVHMNSKLLHIKLDLFYFSQRYIRHYKEEEDPDYNLPDDDEDWVSNLDELEEVEEDLEEEINCLIEDLKQPVPDLQRF